MNADASSALGEVLGGLVDLVVAIVDAIGLL